MENKPSLQPQSSLAPSHSGASIEADEDGDSPPGPEKAAQQRVTASAQSGDNQPKSSFFKRAFSRFSTVNKTPAPSPQMTSTASPIIEEEDPSNSSGEGNKKANENGPKLDLNSLPPLSASITGGPDGNDCLPVARASARQGQTSSNAPKPTQGSASPSPSNSQKGTTTPITTTTTTTTTTNPTSPTKPDPIQSQPQTQQQPRLTASRSHRTSTDVVRIARVYIDSDLLAPEQTTAGIDDNRNKTTPTTSTPALRRQSSSNFGSRRISMTGQPIKPAPLCLTCHFKPTGDDHYDRETILHSILTKLQLSTESTTTPVIDPSPIQFGVKSADDAQPIQIGTNIPVGDQALFNLLNSTPNTDDMAGSGVRVDTSKEENDSIVASYDEKPQLVPQAKKPGFLSRQFSLAKMNLMGSKSDQDKGSTTSALSQNDSKLAQNGSNLDGGVHNAIPEEQFPTAIATPDQSTTTTNNVVLTPITRRQFDPNLFVLVPYNSSTDQSDLSSLSPSMRNAGFQGLGAHSKQNNNNDDGNGVTGGPHETGILRKMSISNNGFILEYSLISLEHSRAEMTFTTEDDGYFDEITSGRGAGVSGAVAGDVGSGGVDKLAKRQSKSKNPFGSPQHHIQTRTSQVIAEESDGESDQDEWKVSPPPALGGGVVGSGGVSGKRGTKSSLDSIPPPAPENDEDDDSTPLPPPNDDDNDTSPKVRDIRADTTRELPLQVPQFDPDATKTSSTSTTPTTTPTPITSPTSTTQTQTTPIAPQSSPIKSSPSQEEKETQERKENDLFVKLTGSGPLSDESSHPSPQPKLPTIPQGAGIPSYVRDINHIVTDTPVLHLDLVKVNKIKRKLPRTLSFTPTHLHTSVTHKHDCYHEMMQQMIREGKLPTTNSNGANLAQNGLVDHGKWGTFSSQRSTDTDDQDVVFAASPTAATTSPPNQQSFNGTSVRHQRQQSGLNGTNGDLFAYVSAQHLALQQSNSSQSTSPQQQTTASSASNTTSSSPLSPTLRPHDEDIVPELVPLAIGTGNNHNNNHNNNGAGATTSIVTAPTGSILLAATSPTRPLSPDAPSSPLTTTKTTTSGTMGKSPSDLVPLQLPTDPTQQPSQQQSTTDNGIPEPPVQGTLNPGILPYLYRNEAPDQCPRCGKTLESTFSCPLGEVLYASVVHIHSIRLCYLTRSSQLYLTDNAPLVATFINTYLSLCRQKNLTSSFTDLNKIVATHRILSTGAVKFIAVKMNALEQGVESQDLYSAQKITINKVVLSHSNFSQLGKRLVLSQFIPHVVNTQALARAYPVLHHYVLSKGKNEQQLLGSDLGGGNFGSVVNGGNGAFGAADSNNLIPSSLLTTADLATTTTAAADSIFNMFITGGTSFAMDPALVGFGPLDFSQQNQQNTPKHGPNSSANILVSPTHRESGRAFAPGDGNSFTFDRGDSDDESDGTRGSTNTTALASSFNNHSLQFNAQDLGNYLSASNSLVFSNSTLEFAISAFKTPLLDGSEHKIQYHCDGQSNLLVKTIREANTGIGYGTGVGQTNKLGSFLTNIRIDRSHVDKNNQLTPEVLQYLSTPAPSTSISAALSNNPLTGSPKQTPLLSTSTNPTPLELPTATTPKSTAAATITGTGGSANNALLLTANPLNTIANAHPFSNIQTLPFLFLDSDHYSQLLGITVSPNIWRLVVKVMLICSQPNIFKTVINTIPLIHNNHHQIMLSWVKTYETYKMAYDKYYSDHVLSKKDARTSAGTVYERNDKLQQQAAPGAPSYNKNDAFLHNTLVGDDDFTATNGATTNNTISNALTVAEDIFDIQDPNHIFNQQYLSKTIREQISKIDKEGGVLLYRTKQLTSALSQFVQQQHFDELCQFSIAPYTTIDSYVNMPDVFIKKPSMWQQLTEQMQSEREQYMHTQTGIATGAAGATSNQPLPRLEEPDYDTMVTHATQYAIELIIAPPLTPLLDVYLSLKCHSKDHKLHQICLYYTTNKRKQSDYNIPIHLQSPDKWTTAISTMKQITTVYTAVERLQCLLTCCKYIYHTYKLLLYTRQLAYNLTKHHATMNFLHPADCDGFILPGHEDDKDDAAAAKYALCESFATTVTKISTPSTTLVQRIIDHPRKEYLSFRKNKPVIETDIEYGRYIVTNRIPSWEEISKARHGILVRLVDTPAPTPLKCEGLDLLVHPNDDHGSNLNSPEAHSRYTSTIRSADQLSVARAQFILHKDDIGPNSSLCADDFFPIFVYVVMNAKINKLETIKQYIGSMAPRVSLTGEVGYYFTVFEAVIEYIDTLGAQH